MSGENGEQAVEQRRTEVLPIDGPLERGNVLESQNIHVQKGVNTFIQKKTYLGGGKKLVLRFKSHLFLFVKDL